MQSSTSPKKPSPLSFGSPRPSPFRRPESPLSRTPPSSNARTTTPSSSPAKTPRQTSYLQAPEHASPTSSVASAIFSPQPPSASSVRPTSSASTVTPAIGSRYGADPLSRLNPVQVREMRESFQVLDRDNDGQVTREDVAEMLGQLGLNPSESSVSPYFPMSTPQSMNLSTYLSTLSLLLGDLSRPDELNAAFSAFDVDDSGQIDVDELRNALLQTPAEKGGRPLTEREIERVLEGFTSRRILGKDTVGKGRGDVFRYADFISEIQGGARAPEGEAARA